MKRENVIRFLMIAGLAATGASVLLGLSHGKSPSVGWFVAGLVLFFAGKLLGGRES